MAAERIIPVRLHRRDEQLVERLKEQHDIPYAETVRRALGLYRRVESAFNDGFVDLVMQSADKRERHFGGVAEFMPLESKRKD